MFFGTLSLFIILIFLSGLYCLNTGCTDFKRTGSCWWVWHQVFWNGRSSFYFLFQLCSLYICSNWMERPVWYVVPWKAKTVDACLVIVVSAECEDQPECGAGFLLHSKRYQAKACWIWFKARGATSILFFLLKLLKKTNGLLLQQCCLIIKEFYGFRIARSVLTDLRVVRLRRHKNQLAADREGVTLSQGKGR